MSPVVVVFVAALAVLTAFSVRGLQRRLESWAYYRHFED